MGGQFSKIKVLENSALLINMALECLLNIFRRDKDQVFDDVLILVFPLPPEIDLVKFKKYFVGRITYYSTQVKKIMKTQLEKKFLDTESFLGQLFSKTGNLARESLSPAAGPCSFMRKETALMEQIRLLKQELTLKEEQLSHYQKKAAA